MSGDDVVPPDPLELDDCQTIANYIHTQGWPLVDGWVLLPGEAERVNMLWQKMVSASSPWFRIYLAFCFNVWCMGALVRGDFVMVRSRNAAGQASCSWTEYKSIDGLLEDLAPKSASVRDKRKAVKLFKEFRAGYNPMCSEIKQSRYVLSFENGVYLVDEDEFVCYDKAEERWGCTRKWPIACVHYNGCFMTSDNIGISDPMNIATPTMDLILDTQDFSLETKRFFYVHLGRLLHDLNSRDKWRETTFMMGCLGSVITGFVKTLYTADRVGLAPKGGGAPFLLFDLMDKYVVVLEEKSHVPLRLGLSQLKTLIDGCYTQLPQRWKNEIVQHTFKSPVVGSGIHVYPSIENPGDLTWRLQIFNFKNNVQQSNAALMAGLDAERSALILKANRIYMSVTPRICRLVYEAILAETEKIMAGRR
jgi:hypothetical protein